MTIDRTTAFRAFFIVAFLLLIYQFIRLLSPFFTPLLVAITLTLIFYPVHAALRRRLPQWDNLAAGAATAFVLLLVIVPASLLIWMTIQQSAALSPFIAGKLAAWRSAPSLDAFLPPRLARLAAKSQAFLAAWQIDLQDILLKNLDLLGEKISSMGALIVRNVVLILIEVFVTVFTLFFLFRDGEKISRRIVDLIPMETADKAHILARLGQTLSAVVRGVFLTAAFQGLLAGAGYAAAGLRFSIFLGFMTAFSAVIPLVGAVAVWLPVNAYVFMKGHATAGVALLIWNALVVSVADNFLKPYLIGEKAKLPVLFLFFGMLGGLQVYGPVGLVTGPLLIACALSFAKIYREQLLAPPKTDA